MTMNMSPRERDQHARAWDMVDWKFSMLDIFLTKYDEGVCVIDKAMVLIAAL